MKAFVSILILLACGVAQADVIDFYLYTTTHSKSANKTAKFMVHIIRTNLVNYAVNEQSDYKCSVRPTNPGEFNCKVPGLARFPGTVSEATARSFLTQVKDIRGTDIVELKKTQAGVFQAVLKNDDVYHVVMDVPFVQDNSMKCQLSVVYARNKATMKCESAFIAGSGFMVRDIPIVTTHAGLLILGAPQYAYDAAEVTVSKWRQDNAEAIAKVHEVLNGMARMKRLSGLEFSKAAQLGVMLRSWEGGTPFFYRSGNGYEGTERLDIISSGRVKHIHRDGTPRKGH